VEAALKRPLTKEQRQRLRAVPCFARPRDEPQSHILTQFEENECRVEMSAIEKGLVFKRLVDEFGMTQQEISRRTRTNQALVSIFLKLLRYPQALQDAVHARRFTYMEVYSIPVDFFDDPKRTARLEKRMKMATFDKASLKAWVQEESNKLGRPAPKGYAKRRFVELDKEHYEDAEERSKKNGMTLMEYVQAALEAFAQ
jgi:hypothetical protein